MAVPKKRTSRSKTKIHRSIWIDKAKKKALKAVSLAKSILTNRSKSFYYTISKKLGHSEEITSSTNEKK